MALKIHKIQKFATISAAATDTRPPTPPQPTASPRSPLHGHEARPGHAHPLRQRADADRLVGGRRRGDHEDARPRLRRSAGFEPLPPAPLRQ